MSKYFYEYLYSKYVLCKFVCQFYDYNLSKEEADKLGIKYDENDIYNPLDELRCVFHRYIPEGMYIWNELGIDKPIITLKEMFDRTKNVHTESINEEMDYYLASRKLKMIDLSIFERNYGSKIERKKADECNIEYDEAIDEDNGYIIGYEHLFESAGEHFFSLFGFEENFVPYSKIEKIEKELLNQLMEESKTKELKLKK